MIESHVGGKTYDLIKSVYTENKRPLCGMRQGGCFSPTLFNIYIHELAAILENSTSPGLILPNSETTFLLYANDLVLLSPTEKRLQQSQNTIGRIRPICLDYKTSNTILENI